MEYWPLTFQIMNKLSIPYDSGPLMPDEFHDWLDKCPLSWVMLEITKEKGTYVFFINENES